VIKAQFPAGHANACRVSKRPTITVKPKEGRKARHGAPWIFSNEIVMDAAAKAAGVRRAGQCQGR